MEMQKSPAPQIRADRARLAQKRFKCRNLALNRAMLESAMAFAVAGDGLAFAKEFVLVRGEPFEAYRTARVQFSRADTQFGAQSVPKTIGESRGSILKNSG